MSEFKIGNVLSIIIIITIIIIIKPKKKYIRILHYFIMTILRSIFYTNFFF